MGVRAASSQPGRRSARDLVVANCPTGAGVGSAIDWALTLHGGHYGEEAKPGRPLLLLSARRSGAGGSLSETRVKRGDRAVRGGEKELLEKLGRNDLCPCGSGRRFQEVLHAER